MSKAKSSLKAMNNRVHILREAVITITQILAGKSIKVTQRGMTASVTPDANGVPKVVNLPYIPDNATDELCDAIQGFLDHEVAHILFTDFKTFNSIAHNPGLHQLANIIEDARIEKRMAEMYQGCGVNLRNTGEFFLSKYTVPKMQEADLAGDEDLMAAVLTVPLLRGMSGQTMFEDFMSDKMHLVEDLAKKIEPFRAQLVAAKDTADVIRLAGEVRKAIRDEEEEEGGGGMPGPGGGKRPKGSSGGASMGMGGSGAGEEEDEEGAGEGLPGEEDEEEPGAGTEEDEEEESKGPGDDEEEEEEEEKEEKEERTTESTLGKTGGAFLDKLDKETANDYDDSLSSIISNDAMQTAKHSDYLVYTKESDVIEPLHVGSGYKPSMFTSLSEAVDHMVGPLQKDLERAIVAKSRATWSGGHRSGRLHGASLSRLITGDDRVFRRKHENTTKDVAASLVIDISGSMSGGKVNMATQTAWAMSQVLERLNIPHEVICFTTGELVAGGSLIAAEEVKMGRKYTRRESLYMPVVRGFGERNDAKVKQRFGWLPHCSTMRNNVDGECIEIAARRLLARREAGKIMMVLSDGAPAGSGDMGMMSEHLKAVIKEVDRNGINVVGIGVLADDVRHYYPKSVVLNNISELPTTVLGQLRQLLIPR